MASGRKFLAACALFGWSVTVLAQSDDDVLPIERDKLSAVNPADQDRTEASGIGTVR
jgi:hypothetical protein